MDDRSTTLVWYPSDRFFSAKGIFARRLCDRPTSGRSSKQAAPRTVQHVARGSRGFASGRSWELEKPMAVAWSKVPYSLGFAGDSVWPKRASTLSSIRRMALLLRR